MEFSIATGEIIGQNRDLLKSYKFLYYKQDEIFGTDSRRQNFKWEELPMQSLWHWKLRNRAVTVIFVFVTVMLNSCAFNGGISNKVFDEDMTCGGTYGGHLQGMATDRENYIYWSHTVALVKTDLDGNVVKSVEVPSHHGDLDYYDGKIYVAVNFGNFNQETGADSWVYVYGADQLDLLAKYPVPEVVHGAGGIAIHNGKFIVVGGLPKNHKENYLYEYDKNFSFVKRHVIKSGQTLMGIQTAAYWDGYWWIGCYGIPENPGLLKVDESFDLVDTYDLDCGFGIIGLKKNTFLVGGSEGEARVVSLP